MFSVAACNLHQLDKSVEEVRAVLRAGRALRVVLDAERAVFLTFHAFDRIVQNIDVRNSKLRLREGTGVYSV